MAVVKIKTKQGVQEYKISDIRPFTWYDTATIVKNQQKQVNELFQRTGGSIVLRNMQVPSSIPQGQEFELQEIRIAPVGTASAADLDKVLKNSVLVFEKDGSDAIFHKPLYEFATGSGVWTPSTSTDTATIGVPAAFAVKPLPFSIFLKGSNDVFKFRIVTEFQFAADETSGNYLNNDVMLQVALVGILKKPL